MASNNTTVHSKMGIVDATGRVSQFCPRIAGTDIFVSGNDYGSGNSIQEMNDNLGKIAFDNTFEGIDDNATSGTSKTYSTKKINTIKTESIDKHNDITDAYNNGYDTLKNKIKSLDVDFPDSDERDPNVMANKIDDVYNKGYNTDVMTTTAKPSDILEGKTFTSKYGTNIIGTMTTIGDVFYTSIGFNETVEYNNVYVMNSDHGECRFGSTEIYWGGNENFHSDYTVTTYPSDSISIGYTRSAEIGSHPYDIKSILDWGYYNDSGNESTRIYIYTENYDPIKRCHIGKFSIDSVICNQRSDKYIDVEISGKLSRSTSGFDPNEHIGGRIQLAINCI